MDLNKALQVWRKRYNIRPIDFSKNMGWSYNYAYKVLRGEYDFGEASWGRFINSYGFEEFTRLVEIATQS